MDDTVTMSELVARAAHQGDYVRFIILSGARTGSHMLAEALNSSPNITCFGEIFNFKLDYIMYNVEGYDASSKEAKALQERDPVAFLQGRIFCRFPEEIRAVGFQYHYGQIYGFPGLAEKLVEDTEIRVLHLRRRNLLRMLVSLKLARTTGVFLERTRRRFTPANLLRATRQPQWAIAKLSSLMRLPRATQKAPRAHVTVSPDELLSFVDEINENVVAFDDAFSQHPKLTVFYEDLLRHRRTVFEEAQSFLSIDPGPLTVGLRRQNPEPLRALIDNYDELSEAFRDSPHAWMFA